MTIRGAEEALPKVTIHLPPTPVTEQAPALPPLTIKPKLPKISMHISSPKTPTVAPANLAKIRLPSTASVTRPLSPAVQTPSNQPSQLKKSISLKPLAAPPPSKKKAKPQPKGQASGMSNHDLQACRRALKRLQTHKHSFIFQQPVDPIRDKAPRYCVLLMV
jgi:transcription initiation factor TFIID subunit 2